MIYNHVDVGWSRPVSNIIKYVQETIPGVIILQFDCNDQSRSFVAFIAYPFLENLTICGDHSEGEGDDDNGRGVC